MLDVLGVGMGTSVKKFIKILFSTSLCSSKRETVNFIVVNFGSAVGKIRAG